jgi:outer membrane lipoprotein carrier protein
MKIKLFLTSIVLISNIGYSKQLNITSIESEFRQSIVNDKKSKIVYKGKMYARSDQNVALWEYRSPINKKIYYQGDGKLVIIEPELEQAVLAKMDKVPNILQLLSQAKEIKPNVLKTRFNGIVYYIYLEGNRVKRISYKDNMDNRVTIDFINQKLNKNIALSRFNAVIPQGYDILEQN